MNVTNVTNVTDYGILQDVFGGWDILNWGIFFIIIALIAYIRLPLMHACVYTLILGLLFMSFHKIPLWVMIIFSLMLCFWFFEANNPRTTSKETQNTMMTICLFLAMSSILTAIQLDIYDIEYLTFPELRAGFIVAVASSIAFLVDLVVLPFKIFTEIALIYSIPQPIVLLASVLLVPTAYILIIRVLNYVRGFG